jgi:MFS transporter, UMF1 family
VNSQNHRHANPIQLRGNKRIIRAWTIYDWANSAFQLSITSAILPAYFASVTQGNGNGIVSFFGIELINTSLYAWTVTGSFLLVACLSPLLSSIADYTGRRKLFMQLFTYLGATGCAMLFFFDKNHLELGIFAFAIASIGYTGGLVFYNAWLPEIAPAGSEDRISARGFALGYTGAMMLLIINIAMMLKPDFFGIPDKSMAARISFVSVGVWWGLFALIPLYHLPGKLAARKHIRQPLLNGYRELIKVWKEFKNIKALQVFLLAFFLIIMSVLTIMYMAANFAKKEIGLEDHVLIPTILIIQILGIAGALLFARLSGRIGNLGALKISVLIWIGICLAALQVDNAPAFMILAAAVGLVMGAVQALARSTYTKLLPATRDHTSYFSFYDVAEKLAVVTGTFLFGLLETLTGSMRMAIVLLGIFFAAGYAVLIWLGRIQRKIY